MGKEVTNTGTKTSTKCRKHNIKGRASVEGEVKQSAAE